MQSKPGVQPQNVAMPCVHRKCVCSGAGAAAGIIPRASICCAQMQLKNIVSPQLSGLCVAGFGTGTACAVVPGLICALAFTQT